MTKEDEYRKNAGDAVKLASRAATSADRGRLLKMGEAWLDLAERARGAVKNLRGATDVHPLVREKIDRHFGE